MNNLLRYRVTSQDGAPARFGESETGYWTPWHIAERRCNDLRAKLEQAEARVAELAAKAHNLSFGIVNSLTDGQQEPFAKQFAELQDCIAAQSSEPYVLRKQAEAVEAAKHEHALTARIPDGTAGEHFQDGFDAAAEQYDASLDRYAQRLRQQADEAELAGGVE